MRTKFVKIGLPNTVITVFLIKGNCLYALFMIRIKTAYGSRSSIFIKYDMFCYAVCLVKFIGKPLFLDKNFCADALRIFAES